MERERKSWYLRGFIAFCFPGKAQLGSHFQRCFSSSKAVDQKGGGREGAMFLSIFHYFTPALAAFAGQILYTVFYHFTPALAGFAAFGCFCS